MMKITVYDTSTGEFLRVERFPDDMLDEMVVELESTEGYVEGEYSFDECKIVDGIPKTKPAKPYAGAEWDGTQWLDSRDANTDARDLEIMRRPAMKEICAVIGRQREKWVTQIPGQETVYQIKLEEGIAHLADPDPDMADYPLLNAELGVTADTAAEVAQVYVNLNAIRKQALADLEKVRLTAVNAVENATSQAEIDAALATLYASLP